MVLFQKIKIHFYLYLDITFTASNMFLSAFVWAVSFWFRTTVAFFSTFMAKILPESWPVSFLTWNTFPYPPLPKTFSNWKSSGPTLQFGGLTFLSDNVMTSIFGPSLQYVYKCNYIVKIIFFTFAFIAYMNDELGGGSEISPWK